ncbi:MAG TPA: hypothetical protein VIU14_17710 [Mesorhizobium sp.]|jgi:hypothetical protein
MARQPTRRKVLTTLGATALAAATEPSSAGGLVEIRGDVTYSTGGPIPEGYLKIRLEDPNGGSKAQRRIAEVHVKSSGAVDTEPFVLNAPRSRVEGSAPLEVVARLEREDGWLIARGSQHFRGSGPVSVTLNTVMY